MMKIATVFMSLTLVLQLGIAYANQMDDVVQALIRSSNEESLESVEGTLLELGPAAAGSLIRLLASEDTMLRMTAVRVLSRMDQTVDEALFQALRDDRWKVRVAAVSVLAHHKSDVVVTHLLPILKDPHPAGRSASARALGRIGDARATDGLIPLMRDTQRVVRKSAVTALGQIGDPRAVVALTATIEDDDTVKREVAIALARIGQPAVQPLAAIVGDKTRTPSSRQAAALALREIAATKTVPSIAASGSALGVALRDENTIVRQAAADALVVIGQPVVDVVRTALLGAHHPVVRAKAAEILGRSGSATTWYAEAVDALVLALDDREESVRTAVRKALVRIHNIAFQQLVAALEDSSAIRRSGASQVLGEIGHQGAISPLETRLALEEDSSVRASMTAALAILKSKPQRRFPPFRKQIP